MQQDHLILFTYDDNEYGEDADMRGTPRMRVHDGAERQARARMLCREALHAAVGKS